MPIRRFVIFYLEFLSKGYKQGQDVFASVSKGYKQGQYVFVSVSKGYKQGEDVLVSVFLSFVHFKVSETSLRQR